jgi:hypothetical protein
LDGALDSEPFRRVEVPFQRKSRNGNSLESVLKNKEW